MKYWFPKEPIISNFERAQYLASHGFNNKEISEAIGVHRVTIQRWFKESKEDYLKWCKELSKLKKNTSSAHKENQGK